MNGLNEASAQLLNHFLTMQMLFQGEDLDERIKETIQEEQQPLKEKIEEFRDRLFKRQQEEKAWGQDVINEISEKDLFEAAEFQRDNIARTLEALRPVADSMENSLLRAMQELAQKNALNNSLNEDLNHLIRQLKNHSYSFQAPLNHVGQKLPSYISHSMQGTLHEYQSAK